MIFISYQDFPQDNHQWSIEEAFDEAAEECTDTLRNNLRSFEDRQRNRQTMAGVKSNLELRSPNSESTALGSVRTPQKEVSSRTVREWKGVEQDLQKRTGLVVPGFASQKAQSTVLAPPGESSSITCETNSRTAQCLPNEPGSTHLLKGVTSSLPPVNHHQADDETHSLKEPAGSDFGSQLPVQARLSRSITPALSRSGLTQDQLRGLPFHLNKYTFEDQEYKTDEHAEESGINKIVSRSPIDTQIDFEELMINNRHFQEYLKQKNKGDHTHSSVHKNKPAICRGEEIAEFGSH